MYNDYCKVLQVIEEKRNNLLNKIAKENRDPYYYEQKIIDKYDNLLFEKYKKFAELVESNDR